MMRMSRHRGCPRRSAQRLTAQRCRPLAQGPFGEGCDYRRLQFQAGSPTQLPCQCAAGRFLAGDSHSDATEYGVISVGVKMRPSPVTAGSTPSVSPCRRWEPCS